MPDSLRKYKVKILSLEAAARVAGAAYLEDGRILAEQAVNGPLTHSETLMPMIEAVLSAAGRTPAELDCIALTCGPGSFTGLRIAAATAKGMALGLGIPLMPIPTLESLAANVPEWPGLTVTVMDARRSQVYGAVYDGGRCIFGPEALPPSVLLDYLKSQKRPCLFLGDAADLYEKFFAEGLGELYRKASPAQKDLRAGVTASLAERKLCSGAEPVPGSALKLLYLRKPQAEREREERLAAEAAKGQEGTAQEG